MGKKILIGSMLVLAMLLLMPSIPAIQQKTIEEGVKQNLQEKLETISLDDLKDIEVLDRIRHPILYNLIISIMSFRWEFGIKLRDISIIPDPWGGSVSIIHPLIFLWWFWIYWTVYLWSKFCNNVSDTLGWGWDIPVPH